MRNFLHFISSRQFVVALLIILFIITIIGVVIPQREGASYYEGHYKPWAAKALITLKLDEIYSSILFRIAGSVLTAVLLYCLVRRCGGIFGIFRRRGAVAPPAADADVPQLELGAAGRIGEVEGKLKAFGFRWERQGDVLLGRRPWGAYAELVMHAGVLFAVAAGLLGLFAQRGRIYIFEGQTVALREAFGEGYTVTAGNIETERDANTGRVLAYRANVRIGRNGDGVAGEVTTSAPLRFGGVGVYLAETRLEEAALALEAVKLADGVAPEDYGAATFDWRIGDYTGEVTAAPGETVPLGKSGFQLHYWDYYEHFRAGEGRLFDDNERYNPAAFISVIAPAGAAAVGIIMRATPELSAFRSRDDVFANLPLEMAFRETGPASEPMTAGRKEYLLASGTRLPLGAETLTVEMAPGTARDVRERSLKARFKRRGGREVDYNFPYGKRVAVEGADGNYLYRFLGSKKGAVASFRVVRDPGTAFLYFACALFSLGVVGAVFLRRDELVVFIRGGKAYVAAWPGRHGGAGCVSLERWGQKFRGRFR